MPDVCLGQVENINLNKYLVRAEVRNCVGDERAERCKCVMSVNTNNTKNCFQRNHY